MSSQNLSLWKEFMKDISSPDSFIEFGFYYLILASLQRRVWCGPKEFPIFPNDYIIFVGDSGVGKGLVVKHVANILKHHKLKRQNREPEKEDAPAPVTDEDINLIQSMQNEAQEILNNTKSPLQQKSIFEAPLLFPVAADAITYEQLVHRMSKSTRGITYKVFDSTLQKDVQKIYTHCSMCFCLEEASSLFRKKSDDTVNFLLNAWDSGDYVYETKTQGIDRIKKCCLSLLAGTTPTFMKRVFNDELLAEGISSRTIFIYEYANRFNRLRLPEYSIDQLNGYKVILAHIKKLSELYGQVKFSKEADELMDKYLYEDITRRVNHNLKLLPYYAKKNMHLQKISMAIHFSDCHDLEKEISADEVKLAIEALERAERRMHFALSLDNKNPLAGTAKNVLLFLKNKGPQKSRDILMEFFGEVREGELREIIAFLVGTGKIEFEEGHYRVKKIDPNAANYTI